jgi:hypothetical protein
VERHRRDLERERRHHHERADREQRQVARRQALAHRDQAGRAGGAVDQRHAVEQEAGRERAHQEVLHRRLVAAARPPPQRGHHVDADRHGLDAEEHRGQVRRVGQHQHAGAGEQQDAEVLADGPVVGAHVRRRDQRGQRDHHRQQRRQRVAGAIGDQHLAVEERCCPARGGGTARSTRPPRDAAGDREPGQRRAILAGVERLGQHQEQPARARINSGAM